MQRRRFLKTAFVPAAALSVQPLLRSVAMETAAAMSAGLKVSFSDDGIPTRIASISGSAQRVWMDTPAFINVRNEVSQVSASPEAGRIPALDLECDSRWSSSPHGLVWDLQVEGAGKRAGHEITIDLPVLADGLRIFTPSNDPEADVSARPTYRPVPYATTGWTPGAAYVLPLVTVLAPATDQALTVALPPHVNIPHLQVEWIAGRTLRLTLGHRAMGGGKPSPLRLLFYAHAADYRSALKAYSDEFPEYFEPPLPRGPFEGVFWYHHIQDHPDFTEMARQHVRYMWSSFWFTYLGDYMPDGPEWAPYTYGHWWKLGQMMSDERIKAFVAKMKEHGIGVYGYFNVTEFGGVGQAADDRTDIPTHLLQTRFAEAVVKDAAGRAVPSWGGSSDMNPRLAGAFWPWLKMQCERYFQRLPELEGLIIDRLDWASRFDYGHDDGFSMIGNQAVENMAMPVAAAVQEVCRLAHAARRRVFVNQFWRVEVLRDVDGYCHECDYVPALAYLAPYRPLSAWEERKDYQGDLLEFEKQMKLRLQFACFPQMIAHQFPISQQKPNARAADLLEIYAPLFDPLIGKRQVLLPHCVAATGDNEVNLFLNGKGEYVAPLTSRTRYRSRNSQQTEEVSVTIKAPDAVEVRSAKVYSADGPAYDAVVSVSRGKAVIQVAKHGTASVVVAAKSPPS
jgi:hypothetical protein